MSWPELSSGNLDASRRREIMSKLPVSQASAMSGNPVDDDVKVEKLKAALWYSIGQTVDAVTIAQDLNATPHFIGGLSEMVWAQIENVAHDLEAFAKHDGRTIIDTKDAVLLGRRNEELEKVLKAKAKAVKDANEE